MSKCLSYHKPSIQIPEQKAKKAGCEGKAGCVLTSQENFQTLEKEMKKKAEAQKKQGKAEDGGKEEKSMTIKHKRQEKPQLLEDSNREKASQKEVLAR